VWKKRRALISFTQLNGPEKLKTAFILREYEGKSYEEIAVVTNCPVGTVRSRIFRAREEIVNYFKEEVYERD
jgi:DNA-directed RNA polymerase specialized sigma subunit, sigma24 homolog